MQWYSGAVIDAVREAKTRQSLFIVFVHDDSLQSQSMTTLWTEVGPKLEDQAEKIVALQLEKDTESCNQFTTIYKVSTYPTTYLIQGSNGRAIKIIDQVIQAPQDLLDLVLDAVKLVGGSQDIPAVTGLGDAGSATASTAESNSKNVEDRVAEARARLKQLHDQREQEAKEKSIQEETERRRLGQQMLLDKQKKQEEQMKQQADEVRRDKLEQAKLQEKLKAQIAQDREDKRRKYEEQTAAIPVSTQPKAKSAEEPKTPTVYTRARLQFRLTDGSYFTEDFPVDAKMEQVYAYLQETLPPNQYRTGSYILRTTHTRITMARENEQTLQELDLVPSAVLLVLNRSSPGSSQSSTSSSSSFSNTLTSYLNPTALLQSLPLAYTWLMVQLTFVYQLITSTIFGRTGATQQQQQQQQSSAQLRNSNNRTNNSTKATPKPTPNSSSSSAATAAESRFKTEQGDKTTIRRFHNAQDDSDDEEKRTWNGNSTQQL